MKKDTVVVYKKLLKVVFVLHNRWIIGSSTVKFIGVDGMMHMRAVPQVSSALLLMLQAEIEIVFAASRKYTTFFVR